MINLSTPSEELWRVLVDEHEKAIYWMKKKFGGEQRYEMMRDDLLRRCAASGKPLASEVIEYTSKEGNRWVCFEQATYYPESNGANCMPLAFCYYETAASLGLFSIGYMRQYGQDVPDSILIYTPHFFQRYAERMGIKGTPRELLMQFISMTPSFTLTPMPDGENEQKKLLQRMPGCICHAVRREEGQNVFEVRTVLTDEQLSYKQSNETKDARAIGDKIKYEPDDLRSYRMQTSGDPVLAALDEIKEKEALGIDMSTAREGMSLYFLLRKIFLEMGLAKEYDIDFWQRYDSECSLPIEFFIKRRKDEADNFNEAIELCSLAKNIAQRIGIKKFNKNEFARHLIEWLKKYR